MYKLVESRNLSWTDITNQPADNPVYAVLHCQSDWFKYKELVTEFVYKFKVTPASEMFVLPVHCILGPLVVVPDLISANVTSREMFMLGYLGINRVELGELHQSKCRKV